MKVKYTLTVICLGIMLAVPTWLLSQTVMAQSELAFINEIHYDNTGTDADEAIEIAGPAGTDLSGWSLELYNGANGTSYDTIGLSGLIPDQQGGYGTLNFNIAPIQNGSPDGIALINPAATVIQFLSYEGAFTAVDGPANGLTSMDIGVSEATDSAVGDSLQLGGTGTTYADFSWNGSAPSTPGAINNSQSFGEGGPVIPNVIINELDSDTASTDVLEFVELYDGGAGNTNLSGLVLVFYNGSVDTSYAAYDLDGYSTDANGYFLLGNADVVPTPSIVFGSNGLQNGADAVALYAADGAAFPNGTSIVTDNLIDAVVYDTADADDVELLAFLNAGEPQVDEDANFNKDFESIGRCPNGEGGARNTSGFVASNPTPGAVNDCENTGGGQIGQCFDGNTTLISVIQGDGALSPFNGQTVIIEGIVTGDFQDVVGTNGDLNGFYVQEEESQYDGNLLTSEGIFVFQGSNPAVDVAIGDVVRVLGAVAEFSTSGGASSLTEISNVSDMLICGAASAPAPTDVVFPVAAVSDLERYEGMLVRLPQQLVISEYFNFDRFNEIVLALPLAGEERPHQPTAVDEPGSPEAAARADLNARSRITLDDGRSSQNTVPAIHPNGGVFTFTNTFRGGDLVTNAVGVVDDSFGLYRIQPTQGADYTPVNPRAAAPDDVGGRIKVASFNVLNYFTTIDPNPSESDQGGGDDICGGLQNLECRGADNVDEFERQQIKIVEALAALDADVVGLIEIENTAGVNAVQALVDALNARVGAGTYAAIDTGTIGTDAIKVAFIYQPATVTPAGPPAVLDDPSFVNPFGATDDRNRPAVAQTFDENATGERFTAVVNHLKSKGSGCGAGDDDPEQGNCNATRAAAADVLVDWLAGDPTASNDPDFLIIGDLNAYDKEDPIDAVIEGADDLAGTEDDFIDLAALYGGEFAYSYVFDGQFGYLDYALANQSLVAQTTGANEWHVNADEPDIWDYDTQFNVDGFYEENQFRASDHDPVVVGLDLASGPVATTITIQKDSQPDSARNFRFDGDLGRFRLDDLDPQDGDQWGSSATFDVAAGTYTVYEQVPNKWYLAEIVCDTGGEVDLTQNRVTISVSEGDNVTCSFVNQRSAKIRVIKYNDKDQNGERQKEKGLKNWTITVYDAAGAIVAADKTNGSGKAVFSNLVPGDYTVCEIQQSGWANSQPGVNDPAYGEPCYSFTLASAETATVEFGNYETGNKTAVTGSSSMSSVMITSEEDIFTHDDAGYDEEYADPFLLEPLFIEDFYMPIVIR